MKTNLKKCGGGKRGRNAGVGMAESGSWDSGNRELGRREQGVRTAGTGIAGTRNETGGICE